VSFRSLEMREELRPFELSMEHQVFSFRAGEVGNQFHPFSIMSAPGDRTLMITVKAVGDYTRALRRLEVGADAVVEGPYEPRPFARDDRRLTRRARDPRGRRRLCATAELREAELLGMDLGRRHAGGEKLRAEALDHGGRRRRGAPRRRARRIVGRHTARQTQAAADAPAATVAGSAAAGRVVFASAGCGACHTLAAAGASGKVGPSLDDAKPDAAHVVEVVTHGKGAMPPYKGRLTDEQIRDVAAYVAQSAGT
jgi:cytochrome c553